MVQWALRVPEPGNTFLGYRVWDFHSQLRSKTLLGSDHQKVPRGVLENHFRLSSSILLDIVQMTVSYLALHNTLQEDNWCTHWLLEDFETIP